ncbi:hypothetical protein E2562_037374 [Oryza meyeriana var. granulata]|uniref:Secreted protein n=1 Tax=Oryza meyeriana var. granulata TaxID=110450 RepID=A0A6G1ETP7_9ORYZ|nr:hypothetical protein E2562_037374 [Oryza meyeriana var. granulata]
MVVVVFVFLHCTGASLLDPIVTCCCVQREKLALGAMRPCLPACPGRCPVSPYGSRFPHIYAELQMQYGVACTYVLGNYHLSH